MRICILLLCLFLSALPAQAEDSLEIMIGQMLMVGFRGLEVNSDSPIVRDIADGLVGGVILFDRDLGLPGEPRNIADPEQVSRLTTALQQAAAVPLFIAVDQEGGKVQRLKPRYGFFGFPSAQSLGEGFPGYTRAVGAHMGLILSSVGCNLNFAPVVDLNLNPNNPVIGGLGRSFGADYRVVADHGAAFIRGLADHNILACPKHFPGHGSSTGDTHQGLTDVTLTWSPAELEPYRILFSQNLCSMLMTAHIVHRGLDPDHPATFSHKIITELLREKLGFTGVVVSDDLQMAAVAEDYPLAQRLALAVNAGVDVLLFGNNLSYDPEIAVKSVAWIKKMVEEGEIPRKRIEESYARIMALKQLLP